MVIGNIFFGSRTESFYFGFCVGRLGGGVGVVCKLRFVSLTLQRSEFMIGTFFRFQLMKHFHGL